MCEGVEEEWRTVMPPLRKWGTARGLTIPHDKGYYETGAVNATAIAGRSTL